MRTAQFTAAAAVLTTWGCIVVHVQERSDVSGRVQTDVELMRQATAEVRTLGTAFESFAVDTNGYPTTTESDRTVGDFPLSNIESLSTVLKIYARPLPKLDPWDSPYLFWSDGHHYAVICLGADATISRPGDLAKALQAFANGGEFTRSPSHCIEDDIVFANGSLVWFPRDWVRRCDRSATAGD
jgi:hypothetical protein